MPLHISQITMKLVKDESHRIIYEILTKRTYHFSTFQTFKNVDYVHDYNNPTSTTAKIMHDIFSKYVTCKSHQA